MASVALAPPADTGLIRAPPKPLLLAAIARLRAAAGFAVVLALTSDHVREPEVQAALIVWVILAYVLAGVIAWWRRPESRLGLLMIAGFGTFISMLGWSNNDLPHDRADVRLSATHPLLRFSLLSEWPTAAPSESSSPRTSQGSALGSSGCCSAASGPAASSG